MVIYYPVHNFGAGGGTPPYHLPPPEGIGYPYALMTEPFVRRALGRGRRPPEGMSIVLDSGAYLIIVGKRVWSEDWAHRVPETARKIGAQLFISLDSPSPDVPSLIKEGKRIPDRIIRVTAVGAGIAAQHGPPKRLLAAVHGGSVEDFRRMKEALRAELRERAGADLDDLAGLALGGHAPIASPYVLTRSLIAFRKVFGPARLHVLGKGSPLTLYLLRAFGVASSDSVIYIQIGSRRRYLTPDGRKLACRLPWVSRQRTTLQVIGAIARAAERASSMGPLDALHYIADRPRFRKAVRLAYSYLSGKGLLSYFGGRTLSPS